MAEIAEAKKILKVTYGSITYNWYGGFGAIFQSYEHNVIIGTMRRIGKYNFYAHIVDKERFSTPVVSWTLAEDNLTAEKIREIKNSFFNE
jgi:hypothetical protein